MIITFIIHHEVEAPKRETWQTMANNECNSNNNEL